MDYNQLIKIITVGDSGVGKSCIILRCTENTFKDTYISTIGVDFKIHTLNIKDNKSTNLGYGWTGTLPIDNIIIL